MTGSSLVDMSFEVFEGLRDYIVIFLVMLMCSLVGGCPCFVETSVLKMLVTTFFTIWHNNITDMI